LRCRSSSSGTIASIRYRTVSAMVHGAAPGRLARRQDLCESWSTGAQEPGARRSRRPLLSWWG
jgi:hypothetical protein